MLIKEQLFGSAIERYLLLEDVTQFRPVATDHQYGQCKNESVF